MMSHHNPFFDLISILVAQKNLHMLCRTAVALLGEQKCRGSPHQTDRLAEANDKDHVSRLLIQGSDVRLFLILFNRLH